MAPRRAVLIVGHGTIGDPDDVPAFLHRIRRGRPAPPELIVEIQRRYRLIGRSPLLDVTESLARALEMRVGLPVRVAMRFWAPLIEDVLGSLVESGVRELCILPVAPFSVHVYVGVVEDALGTLASRGMPVPRLVPVEPYGSDLGLVRAQCARISPLLSSRSQDDTELVLTAHSLPLRVLAGGDPYQHQFEEGAAAVARTLGWKARIAYQSQGEGTGDWLGPTLESTLADVKACGKRHAVVAPVGFLADHVETLYDLDVEAAERASLLGLGFARAPALGDDPLLVDALVGLVERAFDSSAKVNR